jgi:hypothetical protein
MNNTIKLTKEEVYEATETGQLIKSSVAKYGSIDTYVFEREGANYMFKVEVNDGWQIEDMTEAYKVRPVEKITVEWVKE